MPEWLMGVDCKSAGFAYAGSNPARLKKPCPVLKKIFGDLPQKMLCFFASYALYAMRS